MGFQGSDDREAISTVRIDLEALHKRIKWEVPIWMRCNVIYKGSEVAHRTSFSSRG